jgi:hypothetical protein
MAEKCRFNIFILPHVFHSNEERREEEGEKVKHEEKFQNCPFWTYI